MDRRITLQVQATFLEVLESCFQQKEKVHLIVDEDGLTRLEGFIDSIQKETPGIFIVLKGGRKLDMQKIVAVNGIFRPEYGEC